jgi:hypothetical protein
MPAQSSTGRCNLCGGSFSRIAMSRHLQSCRPSGAVGMAPTFHVFVDGKYAKEYWLHVAVPFKSSLSTLDGFLRKTWLECCGHLSAFTINGLAYSDSPEDDCGDRSANIRADRVLVPGLKFSYEYDFGSTTALLLKVVGIRECVLRRGVQLLARNDAPQIPCGECSSGKLATRVCTDCQYGAGGWLCEDCAEAHACGTEMLLPVVNSPRVGVCGYSG